MKKIAIIYATHDGQTLKICNTISEYLNRYEFDIDCLQVDTCSQETLSNYELLVFGSSIRYGKHLRSMSTFLQINASVLASKKTAFFSVNLTARKEGKNTAEQNNYVIKLLTTLDWKPNICDVFAGKLDYPRYAFFDKHIIRFIMWLTKGPTDLNTVAEFTDWQRVSAFSSKIVALANE